jgi:hypothetical protein
VDEPDTPTKGRRVDVTTGILRMILAVPQENLTSNVLDVMVFMDGS